MSMRQQQWCAFSVHLRWLRSPVRQNCRRQALRVNNMLTVWAVFTYGPVTADRSNGCPGSMPVARRCAAIRRHMAQVPPKRPPKGCLTRPRHPGPRLLSGKSRPLRWVNSSLRLRQNSNPMQPATLTMRRVMSPCRHPRRHPVRLDATDRQACLWSWH